MPLHVRLLSSSTVHASLTNFASLYVKQSTKTIKFHQVIFFSSSSLPPPLASSLLYQQQSGLLLFSSKTNPLLLLLFSSKANPLFFFFFCSSSSSSCLTRTLGNSINLPLFLLILLLLWSNSNACQNLFYKTKRFNRLPRVTKGCSKLMHKRDTLSNENTNNNNNNSLQVKNTNNNNKKPKHNANNYLSTHPHPSSSSSSSLPQVLLRLLLLLPLSCLLTKVPTFNPCAKSRVEFYCF